MARGFFEAVAGLGRLFDLEAGRQVFEQFDQRLRDELDARNGRVGPQRVVQLEDRRHALPAGVALGVLHHLVRYRNQKPKP